MTAPTEGLAQRADRAFIAIAVAVVAWLVGTVIVVPLILGDGATRAVTDYLNAVRDGDAKAALRAAGVDVADFDKYDTGFLTSAALSSDWEIASATPLGEQSSFYNQLPQHVLDDNQDHDILAVNVVLRHRSVTGRSVFYVMESGSTDTILTPFAFARATQTLGFLELNGVARTAHLTPTTAGADANTFVLFPGFYRIYGHAKATIRADPSSAMLVPETRTSTGISSSFSLTPKGNRAAKRAVSSQLDTCAKSKELRPADCPFPPDGSESTMISTQGHEYAEIKDISWTIETAPEFDIVGTSQGDLTLAPRNDARVRLSAVGVDLYSGNDKARHFTVSCPINVDDLRLTMTASNTFSVSRADDPMYHYSRCVETG